MKSATLAVLLSCFALTSLATATNSVDFSNGGGMLSGTSAGLTLSGSTLIAVIGFNGGGIVTGKPWNCIVQYCRSGQRLLGDGWHLGRRRNVQHQWQR